MADYFDYSKRFTLSGYKQMLHDIKSKNIALQMQGLEALTETIALADPVQLNKFPTNEACRELIKIFNSSSDPELLAQSTLCIVNILDNISNSYKNIMNANYIQIIKDKLQYKHALFSNFAVAENIIHSISTLSKYRAKEISQNLGIKFIIDNFHLLTPVEKLSASSTLCKLTSYTIFTKFAKSLPLIASFFSSDDEIAMNMIETFVNIFNSVNLSDIPVDTVKAISDVSPEVENPEILIKILELIQRILFSQTLSEAFIDSSFNYEKLLFENDYFAFNPRIQRLILTIIKTLLPVPDFPDGFWDNSRSIPSNSSKFAEQILPILIDLADTRSGDYDLIFASIAMSLKLYEMDVPDFLITEMIAASQDPDIAPFALLLALTISNKKQLSQSGIVSHLSLIEVDPLVDHWYKQNLSILKSFCDQPEAYRPKLSEFQSFKDIFDFFNSTSLSSFELHSSGYTNKFLELIQKEPKKSLEQYDFSHIVTKMQELLVFTTFPKQIDPLEALATDDLISLPLIVDIKCNGKLYEHKKFQNTSLFVAIEAWYNEAVLKVTTNDLLNAARRSGQLGQIFSLENANSVCYTHLGLLHRAFGTKRYQQFSFKIDNKVFSAFDFMFQSIARNLPSPEYWPLIIPEIELIDNNNPISELSEIEVPTSNIPVKPIYDLLKQIHDVCPSINLCCQELERSLQPHLMSFFIDVGLYSPAVQIGYHYPFLFSFDFRTFIFRMISSDFFSALSYAQKPLFNNQEKLRNGRIFNHCTIRRQALFEDGILLMKKIASGVLQIDISFDKEAGFGIGPTKEFISLFAKELTLNKYKMWRNDNENSEFAFTKIGLFPRFDADPQLFHVFGVLCAKSINMNTVLPIPLSVEFFKLIKNEKLSISDIDSEYGQSLKCKEGLYGLTFVLPYQDKTVELIENGVNIEVTPDNVDDYINLLTDYICGSKLNEIREKFCDGFSSVFQKGTWDLLDAREWRNFIACEDISITMADLRKHVDISHGYEKSSPQISMFFEILTEFNNTEKSLFVKFITGSERLPIGGLASLQPKLSIAKRIDNTISNQDDSLPSVMTCTNYFKLPPYSTKETMKEKILKAITEGQGAFLLT